jgi:hypothetical protein
MLGAVAVATTLAVGAVVAAATPVEPYGTSPNIVVGTQAEVCRDGAAADRPGRAELARFVTRTWPRVVKTGGYQCREIADPSIDPACDGEVEPAASTCWSTHAAGRAIDVVVGGEANRGTRRGIALGDRIVRHFLRTRDGVPHAFARATGVQQILWHDRCWNLEPDVDRAARMDRCGIRNHDDHVHLTLSEAGADGLTSWYRTR